MHVTTAGSHDSSASFYDYVTVHNATSNQDLGTVSVYYDAGANGAIPANWSARNCCR